MTVPRFYLPDALLMEGALPYLSGAEARYLSTVLRRKSGDPVRVFNARDGEFEGIIDGLNKNAAQVCVGPQRRGPAPEPDLTLIFAPLKRQATDLVVEKATELGAAVIQPVFTVRTVAETVRQDRWAAIAREAAEQCERLAPPEIAAPVPLAALLSAWDRDRALFFADERNTQAPALPQAMSPAPARAALLIGPEGGFDEAERRLLHAQDFVRPVTLGPRILRAETACIVGLALIQALWGDAKSAAD